uniref:Uncharacterized protein n=1 Tax=Trichogramma kaykai TaxID=54128 RepID=A0ABD2X2C9_9HYME
MDPWAMLGLQGRGSPDSRLATPCPYPPLAGAFTAAQARAHTQTLTPQHTATTPEHCTAAACVGVEHRSRSGPIGTEEHRKARRQQASFSLPDVISSSTLSSSSSSASPASSWEPCEWCLHLQSRKFVSID